MLLASSTVLTNTFEHWVVAESLHKCAKVRRVLSELHMLVDVSVDTTLKQVGKLEDAPAVDVQGSDLVCSQEPPAVCVSTHLFVDRQSLLLVGHDLFNVESFRENHGEHVSERLVESFHLHAHLCSFDRVTWNQLNATSWVGIESVLGNDSTVKDKLSLRCLEYGRHSTVKVNVPLGLFIQINHAFLEFDSFRSQVVASSGRERTQIMVVEAHVLSVYRRLRSITRVSDALEESGVVFLSDPVAII